MKKKVVLLKRFNDGDGYDDYGDGYDGSYGDDNYGDGYGYDDGDSYGYDDGDNCGICDGGNYGIFFLDDTCLVLYFIFRK